jgi:hypothetical protein
MQAAACNNSIDNRSICNGVVLAFLGPAENWPPPLSLPNRPPSAAGAPETAAEAAIGFATACVRPWCTP